MPNLIARAAKQQLLRELDNNKILLVVGPRQSGKTTLLEEVANELRAKKEQVHFYNFDRVADLGFFNNQQKVEAFLRIRSIKSRMYIFVDEVQRKQDAGNFFKFFYDAELNVKFIFSGSSSLELTESFGDALTGRKRVIKLLPLSIQEIAKTTLGEEYDYALQGDPLALEKLGEIIDTNLIWGNYPEVVKKSDNQKFKALSELYESYVQKDVKDLLRVKNVTGFNLLVKLLAHNVGSPLVVEELVRQSGLHAATVNSYLDILEGTMILSRSENHNPDFQDNLPKSKRYYFLDNGFRNYALGQLQEDYRPDARQLAANLIYSELIKLYGNGNSFDEDSLANTDGGDNSDRADIGDHGEQTTTNLPAASAVDIYHYQTYSDNHIDFILQHKQKQSFLPIAVRYPVDDKNLGKKLHEFINTKSPKKLYVVTKDLTITEKIKGVDVKFLPLVDFVAQLAEITSEF